jgi:LPXTG-motif cell wall-anchored protein
VLRFAAILLLGMSVPLSAAMAQNAPPAQDQELKDFKLDKPAQAPTGPSDPISSAQPDAKTPTKPPAQVMFEPTTTQPKSEEPKTATPAKKSPESRAEPKPASNSASAKADVKKPAEPAAASLAAPATEAPVSATPQIDGATGATPTPGADTILNDIAPSPETGTNTAPTDPAPIAKTGTGPLIPALIGAAVVGILGLLMWLWSRRRRDVVETFDDVLVEPEADELQEVVVAAPVAPVHAPIADEAIVPESEIEPEIIVPVEEVKPVPVAQPMPVQVPVAAPITTIAPAATDIKLTFVPERIVISFNSLSLYGDLEIHNTGIKPVHNVKLFTGMITANADQHAEMAAFHAGDAGVDPDELDNMAAGEKIALSLSLVLPLAEIQSYSLGTQQLTVPIMLARVSYASEPLRNGKSISAEHVQTLSCIIGREAVPPQPKMGPLRLDLGPRSYASLGQRDIAA